jgi:hypothetical protein
MHVIACSPIVVGGFPQEKEVVAVPHEASRMLTFSFEQGKPRAYSTYRNAILSLFYFKCMCGLCTMCRVLYDDVIGCILVPFHIYHCFKSIYLYRLDVLCLVDSHR